jgi:hypothetical protein
MKPRTQMDVEVLDTAESVAQKAAAIIAEEARLAVNARGRFVVAVSGGHTPWLMLRNLTTADVPWRAVHIVQVDERVAPPGDADRNLTHLRESLLVHAPLSAAQIHQMPVESADLEAAAADYATLLGQVAGSPPVLDVGPPGPRFRRTYSLPGAGRSGSRRRRYGCCGRRRLSGQAANDAHVSDHKPQSASPVGCHGKRKGAGVASAPGWRSLDSGWPNSATKCAGDCGPRCSGRSQCLSSRRMPSAVGPPDLTDSCAIQRLLHFALHHALQHLHAANTRAGISIPAGSTGCALCPGVVSPFARSRAFFRYPVAHRIQNHRVPAARTVRRGSRFCCEVLRWRERGQYRG